MGIFRVEKTKNYTVMSNYHFSDKRLSLKAKGLLSEILSLPENWDYSVRGLAAINKECKDTISAIVNELIDAGYIEREQIKDSSGHFSDVNYVVYEIPIDKRKELDDENSGEECRVEDDADFSGDNVSEEYKSSKNGLKSSFAPCPKTSDTVNPDTESSDANKILNNKILNNKNIYPSININNSTRACDEKTDSPSADGFSDKFVLETKQSLADQSFQFMLEKIKLQLDYDMLCKEHPNDIGKIDGMIQIIGEDFLNTSAWRKIGKNKLPASQVRNVFLSLRKKHIEYVLIQLNRDLSNIGNLEEYVKAVLYNSLKTTDFYNDGKNVPAGRSKVHNFDERTDTDWDALELKLLQQG